ncbi:hypothetical protein AWZ03_013546 [Drosophila navojoa]|uniref:Uncharacterized protein n=1 Tax=Drosophila navojoa TaxID=7232 RepID=A0A484ATT6_DRONA|nr:hypothetical protein AWZ03_013546 [Drosophila navojoa]
MKTIEAHQLAVARCRQQIHSANNNNDNDDDNNNNDNISENNIKGTDSNGDVVGGTNNLTACRDVSLELAAWTACRNQR